MQLVSAGLVLVVFVLNLASQPVVHATEVGDRKTGEVVDFARDVLPILTKAGCNSGACHGAASGRGYLNLSLFGSRPGDDYEAVLHTLAGRFVDLQEPRESLILQKPSGYLDHGGDVRLDSDGEAYELLRRWVMQGASSGALAKLKGMTISPSESLVLKEGETASIRVALHWHGGVNDSIARFFRIDGASDASQFEPSQADVVRGVSFRQTGNELEFTAHEPGYWPVTIRVGAIARTIQIWAAPTENAIAEPSESQAMQLTANSSVDYYVASANRRIGSQLAESCPPEQLVRRLWLDLMGRPPNQVEWLEATQRIKTGDKEGVVDQLLASPMFFQRAGKEIASWIPSRGASDTLSEALARSIASYLERSDNMRELAREMLSVGRNEDAVSSDTEANPLNRFHAFARDPRSRSELVASVWLGVRVGCAQCHDHPLDHWTQDDYFAMAACWAEIESEGQVRRIKGRTTTDLRSGRAARARLPGAVEYLNVDDGAADEAMIQWLTNDQQFATNIANRTWFWLMGTGLVEEIDDQRATNPSVNVDLHLRLSESLKGSGYSIRNLVREIVLSDAYARVSSGSDNVLSQRLLASRVVKTTGLPVVALAANAFGISTASSSAGMESESMMMMVPKQDTGCGRSVGCSDPFRESLSLISGNEVNRLIEAGVRKFQEGSPSASSIEILNGLHLRMFGAAADVGTVDKWKHDLRELPEGMSPDSEAARHYVEDLVWSWVVSDRFRLLH